MTLLGISRAGRTILGGRKADDTVRVLHLGFEDPQLPEAGGGSARTHQINRRLADQGFHVVVVTTAYPGSTARVQDGVRYVPIGIGEGRNRLTRLLGYVLMVPVVVLRYGRDYDLVVEDFFAPFSSMAVPRWTSRPTVAVVQWLHAKAKSREYHLPLHFLERLGTRSHSHLIAVSHGLAADLAAANPAACVHVVGNGVDPALLSVPHDVGDDLVYLGRLELLNKGLDLLLRAWQIASRRLTCTLVIAGDGPDREQVADLARQLGVADRVRFVGWVGPRERGALLAGARAVVVPSRHETFGMVAVEAQAAGTPVISFDIPNLSEVVPDTSGWRVRPFEAVDLAAAMLLPFLDTAAVTRMGGAGRRFATAYDWDELAERQAGIYRGVLAESRR
jgi:glycogen synthase